MYGDEATGTESVVPGAGETTPVSSAVHRPQHKDTSHLWLPQRRQVQLHQQGGCINECVVLDAPMRWQIIHVKFGLAFYGKDNVFYSNMLRRHLGCN